MIAPASDPTNGRIHRKPTIDRSSRPRRDRSSYGRRVAAVSVGQTGAAPGAVCTGEAGAGGCSAVRRGRISGRGVRRRCIRGRRGRCAVRIRAVCTRVVRRRRRRDGAPSYVGAESAGASGTGPRAARAARAVRWAGRRGARRSRAAGCSDRSRGLLSPRTSLASRPCERTWMPVRTRLVRSSSDGSPMSHERRPRHRRKPRHRPRDRRTLRRRRVPHGGHRPLRRGPRARSPCAPT
jgi:hypothetical protein